MSMIFQLSLGKAYSSDCVCACTQIHKASASVSELANEHVFFVYIYTFYYSLNTEIRVTAHGLVLFLELAAVL